MKNEKWPYVLMGVGFGVAFVCLGLVWWTDQTEMSKAVIMGIENVGIGVGSIGFGGFLTRARRR